LTAAVVIGYELRPQIAGVVGLAFWTLLALVGSAMPVKLPRGTIVSVTAAPIIASLALGGPAAAAIVALIGSTDSRELRRQIPWYGTVFNHAAITAAAILGSLSFEVALAVLLALEPTLAGAMGFIALLIASAVFFLVNWTLAVAAVSARTGTPVRTVWVQDLRGVAVSLIGLAPLAWLMAQIFQLPNGVGWWATPLFVVPLFTTRIAYHRFVETREMFEQTIRALTKAVDARDHYTRNHSDRVSRISGAMARVMRLPEQEAEQIEWAGLLHDIGKIGIRDNILLKEGPLDREERMIMNQHPTIGAEIVAPATQLSGEAPLIRAHHEWINGSGYPDGLEALDIPLGARIMTIADAYEAMTASRPYRKSPLTHEQAVGELEKYAGIQFDAEIVPILVGLDREILDPAHRDDDDLPTMQHGQAEADRRRQAAPLTTPALTATPTDEASRPPSRSGTRRQLASDDVS
jgi:putative nucleotidyltransferase with HDIG domain